MYIYNLTENENNTRNTLTALVNDYNKLTVTDLESQKTKLDALAKIESTLTDLNKSVAGNIYTAFVLTDASFTSITTKADGISYSVNKSAKVITAFTLAKEKDTDALSIKETHRLFTLSDYVATVNRPTVTDAFKNATMTAVTTLQGKTSNTALKKAVDALYKALEGTTLLSKKHLTARINAFRIEYADAMIKQASKNNLTTIKYAPKKTVEYIDALFLMDALQVNTTDDAKSIKE